MDTRRFDDLIRSLTFPASRRGILSALAGAFFLSVPLVASFNETEAKRKKRRKKHRKNAGSSPSPSSPPSSPPPPPPCTPTCSGVTCGEADGCGGTCGCAAPAVCEASVHQCCHPEGTPCTAFEGCCSQTCDSLVGGGTCAPCRGRTCSATRPCCGGLSCVGGYCDGCRDRATSCTSNAQCCFSNCTGGACLSALGGPCARDVDCRSCYLSHTCTNACVGGTCAV
jgi:hypothetical protein